MSNIITWIKFFDMYKNMYRYVRENLLEYLKTLQDGLIYWIVFVLWAYVVIYRCKMDNTGQYVAAFIRLYDLHATKVVVASHWRNHMTSIYSARIFYNPC